MNKSLIIVLGLCCVAVCASALTVEDVLRMSASGMSDELIVSLIATSRELPELTTEDILLLKKSRVSEKIIVALIKLSGRNQHEAKEKEKGFSSFDQFFLSPYYSREYGWPRRNYKSPGDILRRGLYYNGPDEYPDARHQRIYGWSRSIRRRHPHGWYYESSPFSIIVPRHKRTRRKKSKRISPQQRMDILLRALRARARKERGKPEYDPPPRKAPKYRPLPRKELLRKLEELKDREVQKPHDESGLGAWYGSLKNILDEIQERCQKKLVIDDSLLFHVIDIQAYHKKIVSYPKLLDNLEHRIVLQRRKGNDFIAWLKKRAARTPYQEKKQLLAIFLQIAQQQPLELPVDDELSKLVTYCRDWDQDQGKCKGPQASARLEKIIACLKATHQKFATIYHHLDVLLFEFEIDQF